jgi:hypothetical protein
LTVAQPTLSNRTKLAIAGLLALIPLFLAVERPLELGQRDETGLMVSWVATPIAAALLANVFAQTRGKRVWVAFITGAAIAVAIGIVTRAMWLTWAEDWMLEKRGIVDLTIIVSVIGEVIGGMILTLAVPARTNRDGETLP